MQQPKSLPKALPQGECQALGEQLFQILWNHYRAGVPDAVRIEEEIKEQGETWSEDHVAFRCLPGPGTGAHVLQALFERLGYVRQEDFRFEQKKLNAFWLAPPGPKHQHSEKLLPKVFVSELDLASFSENFQNVVRSRTQRIVSGIDESFSSASGAEFLSLASLYLTSAPPWGRISLAEYQILQKESEYGAWTALFGSQANHFTVSVHLMQRYDSLEVLNEFIETQLRIPLNRSGGGLIKGNSTLLLEQSATLAAPRPVLFEDGALSVPFAFIEFAFRYPLEGKKPDAMWDSYYQGFREGNADKIFESTDSKV